MIAKETQFIGKKKKTFSIFGPYFKFINGFSKEILLKYNIHVLKKFNCIYNLAFSFFLDHTNNNLKEWEKYTTLFW